MGVRNLALMIHEQTLKYSDRKNALFYNDGDKWVGISWKELGARIDKTAKGLLELGVAEKELVAIYSENRPEWTICDYAIMSVKGCPVAIYATNTAEQAEFIVNDSKIKVIFVGAQFQFDSIMKFMSKSKTLKTVIVFNKSVKIAKSKNVMYLDDLYELGEKSGKDDLFKKRLASGTPDDIATIIYTSGTTGDPKGAMIDHESFFTAIDALNMNFVMGEKDAELQILPLSHVYGKCSAYWIHSIGSEEYFCDNIANLLKYFAEVKPTYMAAVPRVFEKMYGAVMAQMETAPEKKKKIFMWGIETGKNYRYAEKSGKGVPLLLRLKHAAASKLVLKKIRTMFGGRLNFFSAGGASLAKEIEEFFFAANIFIAQGYGITETGSSGSYNRPATFKFGTVGKPTQGVEIKIAPDGEILIKGKVVMKGYYGKPDATKDVMTKDGYYMTGDIGIFDEDGFLKITDRKKDIIVTSNGKNVAPQIIESKVGQDFFIEQITIIGDKQKYLTALIVPSFDALKQFANSKNIPFKTNEDLVKNQAVINLYKSIIELRSKGLAHFEQIQKFTLLTEPFSIEKGEMTPTLKIKRKGIANNFKDVIKKMYAD